MISCPRFVLVDEQGVGVVMAPLHIWPCPARGRVVDWPAIALLVRLDVAGEQLDAPLYRTAEAAVARAMYRADGGDEPVWEMNERDRYDLSQLQRARSVIRRR
jgi:hypothetical protein